jgi:hypothetical protein
MGEGIQLWDMRKLAKPLRRFTWDGPTNKEERESIGSYYVDPTINVVKFAPIAGTMGIDSDYIVAGCMDKLEGIHAKCINTRSS